jgi:hypothetical protein
MSALNKSSRNEMEKKVDTGIALEELDWTVGAKRGVGDCDQNLGLTNCSPILTPKALIKTWIVNILDLIGRGERIP